MADRYNFSTNEYLKAPAPPPPKKGDKKELLIFAIYVNIGNTPEAKARAMMMESKAIYDHTFKEIEYATNYIIRSFVFPIKEGNTRMECVFSENNTNMGEANMEELFGTLEKPEEKVEIFSVGEETYENPHGDAHHNLEPAGLMHAISPRSPFDNQFTTRIYE
jgi:hypothetical protein